MPLLPPAWVVTRQLDVNDRQVHAIRDALKSADYYFLHAAAERAAERPDLLQRYVGTAVGSSSLASGDLAEELTTGESRDSGARCNGSLRQLGAEMSQAFKMVRVFAAG